jgi:HTH-type transcriptional regulator, competence development regulator
MLKDRLIFLRKQIKLTQYEVADRLGYSRGKLANYEQGSREPDYETLKHIANFYDTSLDYLLGRTDNPKSDTTKFNEGLDALYELNSLLETYGVNQSELFDIKKWKVLGAEGIKQLENYFRFTVEQAERQNRKNLQDD